MRSKVSCHMSERKVDTCTPLVTWPIGFSAGSICGHSSAQIWDDTWPCTRETPFWWREPRMASAVMLKSLRPGVWPSAIRALMSQPMSLQQPSK